MAKPPPPFHNPFVGAKQKLASVVKKPDPVGKAGAGPKTATATATVTATIRGDEALFLDEVAGVARLTPDPRGRVRAPEAKAMPAISRRALDDAEAYAELADLVEGTGIFDIGDSDEFIEGITPGLDRRILKKLKRGDFALQGHLDLHGLTREEARAAVEKFLAESRAQGRRCVLIVHGRGLNSKDQIPVLKERVQVWLTRGRIGKAVLAFCTAQQSDGGAGAVYVLLRR